MLSVDKEYCLRDKYDRFFINLRLLIKKSSIDRPEQTKVPGNDTLIAIVIKKEPQK